ncbi:type I methionyl aminopeptidase [Lentzea sp. NBRC 102530]|uniref:type I methionyl aminopeptidase n=1 Tax=Lentzea sp. NBRC 102530 TaxID=3032201 RepID=UPI0024A41FDB|nr:type I methionyl aminopeptidase [Lentzea sp. NBRC 102530]GLY53080.1 methionine aminopeptidase [Lentzea sp. NBRC 102530]
MIELKSPAEIERMHVTGQFIGEVLDALAAKAVAGVNLLDLEHHARHMLQERGAVSCYWDYSPSFGRGPFRNVTCLAVNDAVLHGLPKDYVLQDSDVLTMDIAVTIDGWAADSAMTVVVGNAREEDLRLVKTTEIALAAAIEQAQVGNRIGDISAAIGEVCAQYGYKPNLEFGGHGIGRTMHEAPHISNDGRRRHGMKLKPGLTVAIEPWLAATTDKIIYDDDGWTLRSADGSRTAHSEHTVAITEDGPLVLTRRKSELEDAANPDATQARTP